jgi:hypothetical protein
VMNFCKDNNISKERLVQMLADAETGIQPPAFLKSRFTKIEPGNEGARVSVIRFDNGDEVVVNLDTRQLVGRRTERLFHRERWSPPETETQPSLTFMST